jgi:transposase
LTLPFEIGGNGAGEGSDQEGEMMRFVKALSQEEEDALALALRQWGDPAALRRARAVRLSSRGWKVPKIAEALECNTDSVRRWIDHDEAEGLERLKTRHRSGRPPKVDGDYLRVLDRTLQTPPRELGLGFNCWTLPRLGIYMDKKTGVAVSSGHMSRLLRGLGYVYKRARHDLSHKRDQGLYEIAKKELTTLKKGLSRRKETSNCCSWTNRKCT